MNENYCKLCDKQPKIKAGYSVHLNEKIITSKKKIKVL